MLGRRSVLPRPVAFNRDSLAVVFVRLDVVVLCVAIVAVVRVPGPFPSVRVGTQGFRPFQVTTFPYAAGEAVLLGRPPR